MQDAAFLSSRRFGGIARLYGDEGLARFSRAHVCVVGVGGVGSWAVEALVRTGIGRLTLIDLDNVAESAIDQVRVKAAMAAYFVRHKQPFIISGGAGGQKNPALIQTADLSRVTHDPLLSNLRYTLRKRYGFSRDTKEKMRVPCVYSTENITPPQSGEACSTDAAPQGLSCAGYGASMLVTASFGLYCAQAAVEHIAGRK